MGAGCFFGSMLVLALFFRPLACQEPNTDGFFVAEFLKNMGLRSSPLHNYSAPVCSWRGVFCDDGRLVKFLASGLGLSGPIPDNTIGKLSMLQVLDLSNNTITALPSDFWSLGSLKEMDLSSNQISGPLANNIGNFAALEMLDLSGNNFSGEIPSALGSLTSLRILSLGGNEFEGSIPDGIVNCHSLVRVDLSFNKLDGALPDGLGVALPMLQELNVAGNSITGRGMDFLLMNSLTGLNISGNMFQGSVLSVFQETLKVIDLSRNQFQGHISQVQFNSAYDWSNLEYLDLSENDLSGEIIQQLNQAPNLKHLNIAFNRFSRQGFPEMDGLWNLEYLNMSRTGLTGHIPTDLSKMANLKALDLSMNHLTDQVPLLPVINLQVVDFSHNNLSGEIHVSLLKKLPYMERFNFSYNNFTFCTSDFSSETLQTHFIGSSNDCPIAVNPSLFRRKVTKHKELVLVLVLTTSVIFLLVVVLFLAFAFRRKSKLWTVKQTSCKEEQTISGPFSFQTDSTTWVADVKQANSVRVVIFEKPLLNITFADLFSATSSFDRGTLLAEGKFGPVYRGFLPGGVQVAVKVLVHGSTLTDHEAARELEDLGRIKHLNLVPLTGYCIAGDQRFAIYDYMENGNLQNLLHDLPLGVQATEDWSNDTWEEEEDNNGIRSVGSEGSLITWRFRHKIALGTARALAFLHHGCSPPIIHRDVKASSVYLDYNLEPRLSDFGLAKVFGNGLDEEITRGSPGYVPPEFSDPDNNHPTTKSDVYCFGVVLFELLTGKKPVEDDYPDDRYSTLVSWVRGLVRNNQVSKAIDPKIFGTGSSKEMEETLKIGYLCTAELPSKRPSMQQIVGLLKDVEPTSARH